MDARMISFWGCETNPYANSDTANNGGGYSQPSGGILVSLENGEYLTVTVDDTPSGNDWLKNAALNRSLGRLKKDA